VKKRPESTKSLGEWVPVEFQASRSRLCWRGRTEEHHASGRARPFCATDTLADSVDTVPRILDSFSLPSQMARSPVGVQTELGWGSGGVPVGSVQPPAVSRLRVHFSAKPQEARRVSVCLANLGHFRECRWGSRPESTQEISPAAI